MATELDGKILLVCWGRLFVESRLTETWSRVVLIETWSRVGGMDLMIMSYGVHPIDPKNRKRSTSSSVR